MAIDWFGYAYAATVAAGGIMGYAKAGMLLTPNHANLHFKRALCHDVLCCKQVPYHRLVRDWPLVPCLAMELT